MLDLMQGRVPIPSSSGLGDDPFANQGPSHGSTTAARIISAAATPSQVRLRSLRSGICVRKAGIPSPNHDGDRGESTHWRNSRYGKAPASCWRERVDNAGASFAWRAPSSSRPFEGARVLTGYCTLVKGFGNSG